MTRALVLTLLLAAASAFAQSEDDDAPIPYPDEEQQSDDGASRDLPRRSDETPDLREESTYEEEERLRPLALDDDPNIGVGGEVVAGMMLFSSSRGQLAEPRFAWGLRFNWEFGRLIADDFWHEALFADVTWAYGALHDGTQQVFTDSNYHFFTVAPAFLLPVRNTSFGFYGQLGGGVAYLASGTSSYGSVTTIASMKPVLQYGLGFRARPLVGNPDGNFHLTLRFEVTRFRRGYVDDTLVAASCGAAF